MAVMVMEGRKVNEGDRPGACLYCSTSGHCFGPLFEDADDAERFVSWAAEIRQLPDLRRLSDEELRAAVAEWRQINAQLAVEV